MLDTKYCVKDAMNAYYSRDAEALKDIVEKLVEELEMHRANDDAQSILPFSGFHGSGCTNCGRGEIIDGQCDRCGFKEAKS